MASLQREKGVQEMKRVLVAVSACAALFTGASRAEVFFGVTYEASLGDIKKLYPNAQYTKVTTAWLTENEAFFKVTGSGLGGELRIAFTDYRPGMRKLAQETTDQELAETYRKAASKSEDESLRVDWVRLIYTSPIPLEAFKKKYGQPTPCSHDETFDLKCRWPAKAIVANMSKDGNFVHSADTSFTQQEKRDGYQKNWGWTPPGL